MSKNKLARFAENETFPNLFQHPHYNVHVEEFPLKGKWRTDYFKNSNPLVIEVGCGRGEYTLAMASRFPECNFVGIDRKGARLWRGCKSALEMKLDNVAFLRIGIDTIPFYFGNNEVDEIWVTFPDPQPKKERRRLVSPVFIERYKQIMKPGGVLHLKTDSRELYRYTLETAEKYKWNVHENREDIYLDGEIPLLTEIQTFYEKMWLKEGRTISYVKLEFH